MASFLQKSNPWIEDAFVYAASFEPNASAAASSNDDGGDGDDAGNCDDVDGSARGLLPFDSQAEPEPQTENTIPTGLLPSPEGEGGGREGDARRSNKVVQVIQQGGEFGHYFEKKYRSDGENSNDGDGDEDDQRRRRRPGGPTCPPYLIVHDGRHSAVAFLSEETVEGLLDENDGNGVLFEIPPNKSLIGIADYTFATILKCTDLNFEMHEKIMVDLSETTSLLPPEERAQISRQIGNPKLFMCLYLQGPITMIGAENQGLIGTPTDVHCSAPLRQALMDHERRNPGQGGADVQGWSHFVFNRRLEACHCHYQHGAGIDGGVPFWPFEASLPIRLPEDCPMGERGLADGMAVPGNVECLIEREGEGSFEDTLGSDLEDGGGTAAEGDADRGRRDLGTAFDGAAEDDGGEEGGGREAEAARGGGIDRDGEDRRFDEGGGGESSACDGEGAVRGGGVAASKGGNDHPGVSDSNDAAVPSDDIGNRDDEPAPPGRMAPERGNVAELFANFDDLNDVLDLPSLSPSSDEYHTAEDGYTAASEAGAAGWRGPPAARADPGASAPVGHGGRVAAGPRREERSPAAPASKKAAGIDPHAVRARPPEEDGNGVAVQLYASEIRTEAGRKSQEGRGDAAASFVGIDDMILEDTEDENEKEDSAQEDDNCHEDGKKEVDGGKENAEPDNEPPSTQSDETLAPNSIHDEGDSHKEDGPSSRDESDVDESEEPLFTQPIDNHGNEEEEVDESQILLSQTNDIGGGAVATEKDPPREDNGRFDTLRIPLMGLGAMAKNPLGRARSNREERERGDGQSGYQSPLSAHCASMRAQGTIGENDDYDDYQPETQSPLVMMRGEAKKASELLEHVGAEEARGELYQKDHTNYHGQESQANSEDIEIPKDPLLQQKKKPEAPKQGEKAVYGKKVYYDELSFSPLKISWEATINAQKVRGFVRARKETEGHPYNDESSNCRPEAQNGNSQEHLIHPQPPSPKKSVSAKQGKKRANRKKVYDQLTYADPSQKRPHKTPRKQPTAGEDENRSRDHPVGSPSPHNRNRHSLWWEFHSDDSDSDNWMRVASRKKVRKKAKSPRSSGSHDLRHVASQKKSSKNAKSSRSRRSTKITNTDAATLGISLDDSDSNGDPCFESVMAAREGSVEAGVRKPPTARSQRWRSHASPTGKDKSTPARRRRRKRLRKVGSNDNERPRSAGSFPQSAGSHHARFQRDSLYRRQVDVAAVVANSSALVDAILSRRSAIPDDSSSDGESNDDAQVPWKKEHMGNKDIDLRAILATWRAAIKN